MLLFLLYETKEEVVAAAVAKWNHDVQMFVCVSVTHQLSKEQYQYYK